jgi:hypothetical protein
MNGLHFDLATFVMSLFGFLLYLLPSWGEFRRAKDTAQVGLIAYLGLDPPAWSAAALATVAFYLAGPELIAPLIGFDKGQPLTPGFALFLGYFAASVGPKALGNLVARSSVR